MKPPAPAADAIDALARLGFTALEAEAYTFLLGEPGATGYRIAQGIGKPVANTYKALEALQRKGAILVEEDETRLCRAVPAEELLTQLERGFAASRAEAARALARVGGAVAGDDRVYQLRTPVQVFERARAMVRTARTVVLVDAFPGALEAVRAELDRAVRRGVLVAIRAYAPTDGAGVQLSVDPAGADIRGRWHGEWLNVVVDGAEHLMSFFASGLETVHQAVWSGSPYLSWVYHCALASELVMGDVRALARDDDRLRPLMAQLDRMLGTEAAGYRALVQRFGLGDASARRAAHKTRKPKKEVSR